ncbi:MAG TPA: AgmX/PglI C-terminal domain-containing protein [Kofleriaceae bacterium]|nr:AgmX/PglI C-terminal domain-containing protein [Kofleriaceae bacterium]
MPMRLFEMVAGLATAAAVVLFVGDMSCGGGQKEPAEPAAGQGGGAEGGEAALIPEEKYDEINSIFDNKTGSVSRCYAQEETTDSDKKGHVTIRLTINKDGTTSRVSVMESSFKSAKVGDCVVRMASGWSFPTLPRPLETSHTYVLGQL